MYRFSLTCRTIYRYHWYVLSLCNYCTFALDRERSVSAQLFPSLLFHMKPDMIIIFSGTTDLHCRQVYLYVSFETIISVHIKDWCLRRVNHNKIKIWPGILAFIVLHSIWFISIFRYKPMQMEERPFLASRGTVYAIPRLWQPEISIRTVY